MESKIICFPANKRQFRADIQNMAAHRWKSLILFISNYAKLELTCSATADRNATTPHEEPGVAMRRQTAAKEKHKKKKHLSKLASHLKGKLVQIDGY